jgi:CheY-like chemotaxis protein
VREVRMERPKILIVEDEAIIALDIQYTLENLGYRVPAVVSSGEESIEKASEIHPDLVLMDIKLSGDMDGISAAEQIYNRFRIPVVYLTAYSDEKMLEGIRRIMLFGYISKPFDETILKSTIEHALGQEDYKFIN